GPTSGEAARNSRMTSAPASDLDSVTDLVPSGAIATLLSRYLRYRQHVSNVHTVCMSSDMSHPARTRRAEQAEATRTALLAAARALFAERGYGGVGTREIVH